jgi:hypothetical protein
MPANTNKVIKGRDLMLFDNSGHSFAFATNHTFTINAETAEISSKDHGIWGGSEVTKFTWEITTENLYTPTNYDSLFTLMMSGTPMKVRFGLKAENDNTKNVADGDYDYWTSGSVYYEGDAVITSLVANAANGDNATYTATFTGAGKIAKATAGNGGGE